MQERGLQSGAQKEGKLDEVKKKERKKSPTERKEYLHPAHKREASWSAQVTCCCSNKQALEASTGLS